MATENSCEKVTFTDIFEALSNDDQLEISRPDFKVPLELYLKGHNKDPFSTKAQLIQKFRYVVTSYKVKYFDISQGAYIYYCIYSICTGL